MTKLRVGIIFGGKSAEHEVSVRSARNVYEALDKAKFEPVLIGIEPNGKWIAIPNDHLLNSEFIFVDESIGTEISLSPESKGITTGTETGKLDVIFPILHGPYGEDGTIQGLLKIADVPFVGVSVLGSAVGMDKDIMKRLLAEAGINVAQGIVMRAGEPIDDTEINKLGLPLFVKPANLGSSIGVTKVSELSMLKQALDEAFLYDNKVLIEKAIVGREFECAILGNEHPEASVVGEVMPLHDYYDFDSKYVDDDGASIRIPADLTPEVSSRIQDIAIRTFKALECEGLSRVDGFVTEDGSVIINEINTMPGFTSISMYPKMWEAGGLGYTDLITKLIELAIDRHTRDSKFKTSRN